MEKFYETMDENGAYPYDFGNLQFVQLSSVQKPCWLITIGDDATQFNRGLKSSKRGIPIKPNQDSMEW